MKIAVLGTGMVGNTIADKLVALGHEVRMGARTPDNEKAAAWAAQSGGSHGTFADAAAFGEIVFNCTNGLHALDAMKAAGADNLRGKVVLEIANPLDFSRGMPPSVATFEGRSLGEVLQDAFPEARIVKTLNTVNCNVMVDASRVPGESTMFVAGNDADAKAQVAGILREWFGWQDVVDLGDISGARGLEAWLPLWVRLWGALGTPDFNLRIVRA